MLAFAQAPSPDMSAAAKTQIEIVKASREFVERLAAQSIADLEGQLAQMKAALTECKEKPPVAEGAKP
jgi:hypothetical protein